MHFLLYVCHPADRARTSLQARKQVYRYLEDEHFVRCGRFCGHCDYFSIGGRWSGILGLLRLKHKHPKAILSFLKELDDLDDAAEMRTLFENLFPKYDGPTIVCRENVGEWGEVNDAQLMDKPIFAELRDGFDEYVTHATPQDAPNVIFTDLDETEWPASAKQACRH